MNEQKISPNSLAFIALANEYCEAIERAGEDEREDFINKMTRLLPRIYITASDIKADGLDDDTYFINDSLDEDTYNLRRRDIEILLGEDDSYLEVFEEDMKYSDTPIAASIAEGLCDIFQALYNFLENVKSGMTDAIDDSISAVCDDFRQYWSQSLCNVLRALNHIKYQQ